MIPGYAKLKVAAEYAGVGHQTLKTWIDSGMEFIRLPSGTLLVKYTDIDDYLSQFKVKKTKKNSDKVDQMVDEMLASLNL